jgi:Glycosyltransferase family 87
LSQTERRGRNGYAALTSPEIAPDPAAHHTSERSRAAFVAALAVSAFLVAWGTLQYGFYTHSLLLDTPVYQGYGDKILSGHAPYRDFAVEYPPGALPVFVAPAVPVPRAHIHSYTQIFEGLMGICGIAAVAAVSLILVRDGAGARRLIAALALAALGSLALGPVVLSRFDLWPAALTVLAMAALVTRRSVLALAVLGLAFVAKIYPVVLMPLVLTYLWRREGRKTALFGAGAFLSVSLAVVLPFLALSPDGLWESVSGQASRPLQLESLGASVLLVAHQISGLTVVVWPSHGSDNLWGSTPDALAKAQSVLQVLVLIGLWIAFARGPADTGRLFRFSAAAVCAFIILGKVLSPQYLVWLLPLVPLVRGRRGLAAGALLLLAMALTQVWFPYRYLDLAFGLDPLASWLVLARDLSLIVLLGLLVWPIRQAGPPIEG